MGVPWSGCSPAKPWSQSRHLCWPGPTSRRRSPKRWSLDRDNTGFNRQYGVNPYTGYDNPDTNPFLFRGTVDDRARAKQRVVGINIEGESAAWTLDAISGGDARATHGEVGDAPVVIFWKPGQSSALDASQIEEGRDIGSVGVFSPELDGRMLTFQADGDGFIDEETGSLVGHHREGGKRRTCR
jgi:hypothetical protein